MICCSSKYGSSRRIAAQLGEILNEPCCEISECSKLEVSPLPVLVMPMYASSFYQQKQARELLEQSKIQRFILVTVGLSDPDRPENREAIHQAVKRSFDRWETEILSLRGAIDYSGLSKVDRTLMWMLKKVAEKHPDEAENGEILKTYGKTVSLEDPERIEKTAKKILQIRKKALRETADSVQPGSGKQNE